MYFLVLEPPTSHLLSWSLVGSYLGCLLIPLSCLNHSPCFALLWLYRDCLPGRSVYFSCFSIYKNFTCKAQVGNKPSSYADITLHSLYENVKEDTIVWQNLLCCQWTALGIGIPIFNEIVTCMTLALMLYFYIVAHKASCHTLSNAFLKSLKICWCCTGFRDWIFVLWCSHGAPSRSENQLALLLWCHNIKSTRAVDVPVCYPTTIPPPCRVPHIVTPGVLIYESGIYVPPRVW